MNIVISSFFHFLVEIVISLKCLASATILLSLAWKGTQVTKPYNTAVKYFMHEIVWLLELNSDAQQTDDLDHQN